MPFGELDRQRRLSWPTRSRTLAATAPSCSATSTSAGLGVPTEAFREAPQAPRRKYVRGRKKKQAPPAPRQALCLGCGEPLAASHARQRYHGAACRSRAFRRKKGGPAGGRPCDA